MNEKARVMKIAGKLITLKAADLECCFGCMNQECREGGSQFEAYNRRGLPLEAGQLVEVGIQSSNLLAQGLWALGLPAGAFALSFASISLLAPALSEATAAAASLGVCLLCSAGLYAARRFKPAVSRLPEVLDVLPEGVLPVEGDAEPAETS